MDATSRGVPEADYRPKSNPSVLIVPETDRKVREGARARAKSVQSQAMLMWGSELVLAALAVNRFGASGRAQQQSHAFLLPTFTPGEIYQR